MDDEVLNNALTGIIFGRENREFCIVFRFKNEYDAKAFDVSKHIDRKKWVAVKKYNELGKQLREDLIQPILFDNRYWKYFKLAQDIDIKNSLL